MIWWKNRLHEIAGRVTYVLAALLYWPSRAIWALRRDRRRKLQVGSGRNRLEGWINSDIDPRAELIVIVGWRLPFSDGGLDRVYLEHVLEHVSYRTARSFLAEVHRVLSPGGVIRIAVPDLEDLCRGYLDDDWRHRFDWVKWPDFAFIESRAEMINIAFRWWGHAHLYDRAELVRVLLESGFSQYEFVDWGQSRHADLRGLETRRDSLLVIEATKS